MHYWKFDATEQSRRCLQKVQPVAHSSAFRIYAMKGNPFASSVAVRNSSLHFVENGRLVPWRGGAAVPGSFLLEAHEAFRDFVMQPQFSCLGAKAALNDESYGFGVYDKLTAEQATAGLCRDLCHFARSRVVKRHRYSTFIAVFGGPLDTAEAEFEELLWRQLRDLHQADSAHFNWDKSVTSDPRDPYFSFSFTGQAFYVVGMHANSSRKARRFPWPALVFNPHEQFERLRTDGKWKRMQQTIRAREVAWQGSVNPMLSDFGEESEARQYSGRAVPDDWVTPLLAGENEMKQRASSKLGSDSAAEQTLTRQGRKCPFAH